MDVAQATAAAARDHDFLLRADQVGDQVAGRAVAHERARRHAQVEVLAGLAVAL